MTGLCVYGVFKYLLDNPNAWVYNGCISRFSSRYLYMTTTQKAMRAVEMRKLEIENPAEYKRVRDAVLLATLDPKYHWMVTSKK